MKNIVLIIIVIVFVAALMFYFGKPSNETKYTSPDGNYVLVVTKKSEFFDFTMPGDGGKSIAVVQLENKEGKLLASSKSKTECNVFIEDINVSWDLENAMVNYATARYIKLDTGEILC